MVIFLGLGRRVDIVWNRRLISKKYLISRLWGLLSKASPDSLVEAQEACSAHQTPR
jgi:hypothetical protein